MDWYWEAQLHTYLAELSLRRGDLERATIEASAAREAAMATPERTWRGRAHVTSALVAIERRAFDEAGQYLRQARREVRGIERPPGGVAHRGDDGNPARENRAARLGPPGTAEIRTRPRAAQPQPADRIADPATVTDARDRPVRRPALRTRAASEP